MSRRKFLVAAAVLPLGIYLPATLFAAASTSLTLAIDRTGRCRMLSQRAAKSYALVALKVSPAKWQAIVGECAADMRGALDEMDKTNRGRSFANAKSDFSSQLLPFLGLLRQKPTAGSLAELLAASDKVLNAANSMTDLLEAESRSTVTAAVNKAGRQRMLTQRMARNYVLQEAKVPGEVFKASIERDRLLFSEAQLQLTNAPMNSAEIKTSLEKSGKLWGAFWSATAQPGAADAVATQSEVLLQELDLLTNFYSKLA